MTRCTRSHAEFTQWKDDLTAKAEAGILTISELSDVIDWYYDDGDYINRSVGTSWILGNVPLFMKVVPEEDRFDFFIAHLRYHHSSEVLICSEDVLKSIPSVRDRYAYIQTAFVTNGARNNSWILAARNAGIDKENIFRTLLMRLNHAPIVDQESIDGTCYSEFLGNGRADGFGRTPQLKIGAVDDNNPNSWVIPENSAWGVCTPGQLIELFVLCATRAPHQLFKNADRLHVAVGQKEARTLLTVAARRLTKLPHDLEGFKKLSQERLEEVLQKHAPSANIEEYIKLMVRTVLAASNPPKFYGEIASQVAKVDPVKLYVNALPILAELKDNPSAGWFRVLINNTLQSAGYVVAKLKSGTYEDKKRRETRQQHYVEMLDGTRYVHYRDYNSRYYPSAGDEVIFTTKGFSRRLTPKVIAVAFTPVDASKRR